MPGDDAASPMAPRDLRYVGPATADAIEAAPFDARDVAARRVSYTMLLDAGVNPGVAARLRREYSLVWSFTWRRGADLDTRAAVVSGLKADQREWIAESARTDADGTPVSGDGSETPAAAGRAWRDRVDPVDVPDLDLPTVEDHRTDEGACPRCGAELLRYALCDRESVRCPSCDYVDVPAARADPPATDESWEDALRRFRGDG